MTDPVERAARIIAAADGFEDWHDLTFKAKEQYRSTARLVFDDFVAHSLASAKAAQS